MPYQMHPSGREKGEFFHFAFKNQILEDGKEIRPSFPFDALYAVLKLIESRKGFPVRILLYDTYHKLFSPYRLRRIGCPDKPIKLSYFKTKNQEVRGQLSYAYIEKCHLSC